MNYLLICISTLVAPIPRVISEAYNEYEYDQGWYIPEYDYVNANNDDHDHKIGITAAAVVDNVTVFLGQNAVLNCEVENLEHNGVSLTTI